MRSSNSAPHAWGKDQAREDRAVAERAKRAGKPPRKNARPIEGARCCALTPKKCCHDYVSDGTVRYVHRLLRTALQDAVTEDELLADNVAKRLRMDHKYRPKFKAWSPEEAKAFLTRARGERLYALFAVMLLLGLRRREALGLRWEDLDLDARVIRVSQALQRVNRTLRTGQAKTDESARSPPIPAPLYDVLTHHRSVQDADEARAAEQWADSGLVFTTLIGTPLEPRNVNRLLDRLCATTEVRRIRVHDLRHSCASLLWSQGVPLEQIQDILGHEDPRTTKTIYVDVSETLQREAMDRLGFLLDEPDD